jgi:G3E family GTPase
MGVFQLHQVQLLKADYAFYLWNLFFFSGLAKPSPVIETFCTDELVSRYVKLDGVVTLVDSKHAMPHLTEVKPRFVVNEAVEQVAYADRIILNKVNFDFLA